MADRAYIAENEVERKRLASLVARLSDQDLARPMPGGWTVASVLGHVAFWDQRIIALIEEWRKAGMGTPPKDARRKAMSTGSTTRPSHCCSPWRPGAPPS